MKVKNRHWYNLGEKYVRARFDVKVCCSSVIFHFEFIPKSCGHIRQLIHD